MTFLLVFSPRPTVVNLQVITFRLNALDTAYWPRVSSGLGAFAAGLLAGGSSRSNVNPCGRPLTTFATSMSISSHLMAAYTGASVNIGVNAPPLTFVLEPGRDGVVVLKLGAGNGVNALADLKLDGAARDSVCLEADMPTVAGKFRVGV